MDPQGRSTLRVTHLGHRNVRNLSASRWEPTAGINVIFGENGQGKTSLLEAIYLATTTRSFRTSKLGLLVSHDASELAIRLTFEAGDAPPSVQDATWRNGRLALSVDGAKPPSVAAYARRVPTVVFHSDELLLSTGPASHRRRLLDRIAFYRRPRHMLELARFSHAVKCRREALKLQEPDAVLGSYEAIAGEAGAAISLGRAEACQALSLAMLPAFEQFQFERAPLEIRLAPGGPATASELADAMARDRPRDRFSVSPRTGPHRDDLELRLDGRSGREVASQGQHRALTLAMKAAETAVVAEITGLEPLQLLDDLSSELDPIRTELLFQWLARSKSQVFVTTTRRVLLEEVIGPSNASYHHMHAGRLTRV